MACVLPMLWDRAADLLHQKQDWGELYNLSQLANNTVPIAAVTYLDVGLGVNVCLQT